MPAARLPGWAVWALGLAALAAFAWLDRPRRIATGLEAAACFRLHLDPMHPAPWTRRPRTAMRWAGTSRTPASLAWLALGLRGEASQRP